MPRLDAMATEDAMLLHHELTPLCRRIWVARLRWPLPTHLPVRSAYFGGVRAATGHRGGRPLRRWHRSPLLLLPGPVRRRLHRAPLRPEAWLRCSPKERCSTKWRASSRLALPGSSSKGGKSCPSDCRTSRTAARARLRCSRTATDSPWRHRSRRGNQHSRSPRTSAQPRGRPLRHRARPTRAGNPRATVGDPVPRQADGLQPVRCSVAAAGPALCSATNTSHTPRKLSRT